MRQLVVANWKMNPLSVSEARLIFNRIRRVAGELSKTTVVVAPAFPHISLLKNPNKVKLGSQDVSPEDKGAHTGEVSAFVLADLGVEYSIVGHSERRAAGESSETVSKKIRALLRAALTPILCIGESARDKHGDYLLLITNQIKESLKGIKKTEASNLVIAYEPVWAIGKKAADAMSPSDLHETTLFIRKVLSDLFGRDVAQRIKIIYGGSVEPGNAQDLIEKGNVDGFLVGHASLTPGFIDILRTVDGT